jgi:hypothetical protein
MQLMGIAEFIIGRAFARPVGSTHPTRCHALPDGALKIVASDEREDKAA